MWSPSAPTWHVGLSPQRLELARMSGWWGSKLLASDGFLCTPVPGAEPWRAACDVLTRQLADFGRDKPAVRVVLSGCLVRWLVLPPRAELSRASEVTAYAAHRLGEVYGKPAEHWEVMVSMAPPGRSRLACAVDRALMAQLRRACEGSGARLASVAPYFSSAFDHWQHSIPAEAAWFGVVEPQYITLGLLQRKNWVAVHSQHHDGAGAMQLSSLMLQVGIAAGLSDTRLPLFMACASDAVPLAVDVPVSWLRPDARRMRQAGRHRLAWGV